MGCCKCTLNSIQNHSTCYEREVTESNVEIAFVQEADQRLLARLAEQEAQDQHIQSARREKARADAAWMKKVSSAFVYLLGPVCICYFVTVIRLTNFVNGVVFGC